MRVSEDQCLSCGTRYRPTNLESPYEDFGLAKDGSFMGFSYWFCSVECYKKKLRPFILDKTFDFDKGPKDDPEYVQRVEQIEEEFFMKTRGGLVQNLFNPVYWQSQSDFYDPRTEKALEAYQNRRASVLYDAVFEFHVRLEAEHNHEYQKQSAESEKERIKIEEDIIRLHKEEKKREAEKANREEMLKEKEIPFKYRFDHCHIIGSSGQGKSTLIIRQIFGYLVSPEQPSIVVVDPKGTLASEFRTVDSFALSSEMYTEGHWEFPLLVVIDPTLFPPALNLFAPPKRKYATNIQQQLENNAISLMQYVFGAKGSALTDKQMTCFSFAVSLMFTIPNATIHTFLDLMNDPVPKSGGLPDTSRFKPYIDKLSLSSKRFFYDSFYNPTEYGATKDQISSRIYGMLCYPTFDAMFSTTENNVDMFNYLQTGKVVLISSPKSILGTEGSQLFSRYMVALTLQAAFERIAVRKDSWHPAMLIIDEAQDVIDEVKTPELLEQAREFKLGVTIAHQNIKGQLPDALFSSVSANTRIKYAGTRSSQDATLMARDMHCESEFITKQPIGSFACFVGGMTEHPFSVSLELGEIDKYTKMTTDEFESLTAKLQKIIGIRNQTTHEAVPTVAVTTSIPAPSAEAGKRIVAQAKPPTDPSKPGVWKKK